MQGSVVDNRYDIVRPLGSGGMGEVYLAHDMTLGRDVALKLLRSQFANDRESAERFKREALSAARLSHPNIVQVYDRGDTEDGSSYIAMEYVPGGTLKDRIVEEGPLDPRVAASFGYQVAEALGVAHAKGVIHRDIKPQNVLITPSGGAKVADFGIARAASATTDSHTKTGTVMGTAGYMSPEQALGESATPKSDLYSLGIVLYEAVTGKLPFTAENPIAVSMKHVNEPPRPPQHLNPDVPDSMNAIILKLLAKNPADRYASADDLAEDLLRVRRGAPPIAAAAPAEATTVQAPPPGPTPTTRQPAAPRSRRRRTRGPLVLGLLLLLLGLLGLGWALTQGSGNGGGTVEVPSVEGLARGEAVSRLQDAGFRTDIQTRQGGGDPGDVIDQSPNGGERAPEGSTVTLTVGTGAQTVSVPEVRDLGFADAEAELTNAGLVVGETYDVPSDVAAGVVLEQGIEAGSEVEEGTAVNLGLSTGPAPTTPAPSDASATQQPDGGASADPASASASAQPNADAEEAQKDAREAAREAQKDAREAAKDRAEEIREEAKD